VALLVVIAATGVLRIQRLTPSGEEVVIPTLAALPPADAARPKVDTVVAMAPTSTNITVLTETETVLPQTPAVTVDLRQRQCEHGIADNDGQGDCADEIPDAALCDASTFSPAHLHAGRHQRSAAAGGEHGRGSFQEEHVAGRARRLCTCH